MAHNGGEIATNGKNSPNGNGMTFDWRGMVSNGERKW